MRGAKRKPFLLQSFRAKTGESMISLLKGAAVSFLAVSLVGCGSSRGSSTASKRFGNGESNGQKVFESEQITYLLPQARVRLADQLNLFIDKLVSTPPPKSTLVCMQAAEINGLYLCIGSNKRAQHVPLNRAAIYTESRPSIGVPISRQVVSQSISESGYQGSQGHDLSQANLEEFFVAAKRLCGDLSCLSNGEVVFAEKVMSQFASQSPEGYAVISFDVSDPSKLKRVLSHEISHGQFFQEPGYRAAAYSYWNSVSPAVRLAARSFLSMNYDTINSDLLVNEFHAHTLDGTFESIPESAIVEMQRTDPNQAKILAVLRDGAAQRKALLFNLLSASTRVVWGVQLAR
jgi:hypothetical protein